MREFMKGRSRSDCAPYSYRAYRSVADRARALKQVSKHWTHVVVYLDVKGPALALGHASWTKGCTYIDR